MCAGGVAFAVGAMKAGPVLAALAAPGVGADGGLMNLVFAGIWDAAMAVALAIGLLELAGSDLLAGNSQIAVGSGSSFLLLAGVGSGGANSHCHFISSLPVYVVVVLGVVADVVSGLVVVVGVVAVGGAVGVVAVGAGASGGGMGLGGTGMGTWPLNGSFGFCCLK